MVRLYCRVLQLGMRVAARLLRWRKPMLLRGHESLTVLPALLRGKGIARLLLVTDTGIAGLGLPKAVLEPLREEGIACTVYDKTVANPTVDNIEEALALYRAERCQAIVALGGGSPMDCAKGVGARMARPDKSISQMRGLLKVRRKMPFFIAIPTTAGTGSETTPAAVITDAASHVKYAITDVALIPHCAVLDPALTLGLPPAITAATGMDALTHAVEAYIGRANTAQTRRDAREATQLVFAALPEAYREGQNQAARQQMQEAAFLAGAAFARAYVGNVHAVAHALGGAYGTPHGLANAVILPYVLDAYGEVVHKRLAELADEAGLGGGAAEPAVKAARFIAAIRALNKAMNIPETLADLREEDIPTLAGHALREANPIYPVPVIFDRAQMEAIYRQLLAH